VVKDYVKILVSDDTSEEEIAELEPVDIIIGHRHRTKTIDEEENPIHS